MKVRERERESEGKGGRKMSLITKKCWQGSGAPVHSFAPADRHAHTHTETHSGTHSKGSEALRLLPDRVKPAERTVKTGPMEPEQCYVRNYKHRGSQLAYQLIICCNKWLKQ